MEKSNNFQVFLFNVGQGDHILIRLPDGSFGVIDFYYNSKVNLLGEPPGLTYLKNYLTTNGKVRIKFLHISHYHQDHSKGLSQWLRWMTENDIPLDHLWLPGTASPQQFLNYLMRLFTDDDSFSKFITKESDLANEAVRYREKYAKSPLHALDQFLEKMNYKKADFNLEYLTGLRKLYPYPENQEHSFFVHVLTPSSNRAMKYIEDQPINIIRKILKKKEVGTGQNDISVVLLIKIGHFNLVFGGDAEYDSLQECINSFSRAVKSDWGITPSHFVKLFHHGSCYCYSSSNDVEKIKADSKMILEAFLSDQIPNIFLAISAGENRRYNHPSPQTIDAFQEFCLEKNINHQFFSTNLEYLTAQDRSAGISDVDEKLVLKWYNGGSKKRKKESSGKLLDNTPFPKNQNESKANELLNKGTNFLGYHFDFDMDTSHIAVKKMFSVEI